MGSFHNPSVAEIYYWQEVLATRRAALDEEICILSGLTSKCTTVRSQVMTRECKQQHQEAIKVQRAEIRFSQYQVENAKYKLERARCTRVADLPHHQGNRKEFYFSRDLALRIAILQDTIAKLERERETEHAEKERVILGRSESQGGFAENSRPGGSQYMCHRVLRRASRSNLRREYIVGGDGE